MAKLLYLEIQLLAHVLCKNALQPIGGEASGTQVYPTDKLDIRVLLDRADLGIIDSGN
jgi:hypothetical protein